MEASFHYNGLGADLEIQEFPSLAARYKFRDEMRVFLGQDFDFLLEDVGTPNEHWHVEFQPKAPY